VSEPCAWAASWQVGGAAVDQPINAFNYHMSAAAREVSPLSTFSWASCCSPRQNQLPLAHLDKTDYPHAALALRPDGSRLNEIVMCLRWPFVRLAPGISK